jgi:type II secretory pathway predicted ATPase ExeA
MDLHFYHLTRPPFAMEPEPDALFWSATHVAALQALQAGIEGRQGFITLLGEAGLGKTTVLRYYLDHIDPQRCTVITLPSAHLSWHDMLSGVCHALGLACDTEALSGVVQKLRQSLLAAHEAGRNVVLILDDAHRLQVETLEHLLLFADFEVPAGKLIQIVLAGHPAFAQLSQLPALQALERCFAVNAALTPLTTKESLAYLRHRLEQSMAPRTARQSQRRQPIFTTAALRCIIRHARGNPRRLNILAYDVLEAGLLCQQRPIPVSLVRRVLVHDGTAVTLRHWKLGGVLAGLAVIVLLWRLLLSPPAPTPQHHDRADQPAVLGPDISLTQPPIAGQRDAAIQSDALRSEPTAPTLLPEMTPPTVVSQERQLPLFLGVSSDEEHLAFEAPEPTMETEKPEDSAHAQPSQQMTDSYLAAAVQADTPATMPKPDENAAGTRAQHEFPGARWPFETHVVCATPRHLDGGGKDIILMTYDGYRQRSLIANGALNLMPLLAPNGIMLAYTSYRDGSPNIYLRNLVTGEEERLTSGMGVALPGSWSPNGRYLALSQSIEGNSEIYVYELHRKSLKRLTRHPSIDISPSFAPDSTRLVLTSDRSGSPQLYLTDVHGRLPTRLTTIGHYNTSPVWSPRDDTIAFVGRSVEGTLDIYTIRADGSNLRRLTRGGQSHESPTWAPNGRFVMYTSRDGKMQQRHIIRIDGQEDRILPQSGPVCHSLQWVARHTR